MKQSEPKPTEKPTEPKKRARKKPERDPDLIPIAEVCARYHIDRRGILELVDRGEFPPVLRLSTARWLFRRTEVEAWEAGNWVSRGDLSARADATPVRRNEPEGNGEPSR